MLGRSEGSGTLAGTACWAGSIVSRLIVACTTCVCSFLELLLFSFFFLLSVFRVLGNASSCLGDFSHVQGAGFRVQVSLLQDYVVADIAPLLHDDTEVVLLALIRTLDLDELL